MTLTRVAMDQPMPIRPAMTTLSRPFWDALDNANWVQMFCGHCNAWQFPPPAKHCPTCQSVMDWRPAPITGSVYADTTIHAAPPPFAGNAPYQIGLVDLTNGVRMLTPLLKADTVPAIGDLVEIVVIDYADGVGYACRRSQAPP